MNADLSKYDKWPLSSSWFQMSATTNPLWDVVEGLTGTASAVATATYDGAAAVVNATSDAADVVVSTTTGAAKGMVDATSNLAGAVVTTVVGEDDTEPVSRGASRSSRRSGARISTTDARNGTLRNSGSTKPAPKPSLRSRNSQAYETSTVRDRERGIAEKADKRAPNYPMTSTGNNVLRRFSNSEVADTVHSRMHGTSSTVMRPAGSEVSKATSSAQRRTLTEGEYGFRPSTRESLTKQTKAASKESTIIAVTPKALDLTNRSVRTSRKTPTSREEMSKSGDNHGSGSASSSSAAQPPTAAIGAKPPPVKDAQYWNYQEKNPEQELSAYNPAYWVPATLKLTSNIVGVSAVGLSLAAANVQKTLMGSNISENMLLRGSIQAWLRLNGVTTTIRFPSNESVEDMTKTPFLVSNHISYLDGPILATELGYPKVVSKAEVRNIPAIGQYMDDMGTIWVYTA